MCPFLWCWHSFILFTNHPKASNPIDYFFESLKFCKILNSHYGSMCTSFQTKQFCYLIWLSRDVLVIQGCFLKNILAPFAYASENYSGYKWKNFPPRQEYKSSLFVHNKTSVLHIKCLYHTSRLLSAVQNIYALGLRLPAIHCLLITHLRQLIIEKNFLRRIAKDVFL